MEFQKNNKRLQFLYGGKGIWEYAFEETQREDGNRLICEYLFEDGLKLTNIATKYPDFGAYEWVTWFEMTGEQPGQIISELWDCDADIPFPQDAPYVRTPYLPDKNAVMKIYTPIGSVWGDAEFTCTPDELVHDTHPCYLYPGDIKEYTNEGGRSSNGRAPFFNVIRQNQGVVCAIGWTGQWKSRIERTEFGINIKTKVHDTHFKLLPGEKIRTSSVLLMPYEADFDEAQNKWRRLLRAHFFLINREDPMGLAPLCAGIWGGMPTENAIERIRFIKENDLPVEYIWMDAGWYGPADTVSLDEYGGGWWAYAGDWRVNPHRHPDALTEVSKAVADAGMKYLLWFEPERGVGKYTPITEEHPEYFLTCADPQNLDWLLNLGNEEAWQHCFAILSDHIERLNIRCYRQDFNIDPLERWRNGDTPDRQGISEIKHINGLYRLWDALLEKFPHLIIDNCASGGKRLDIEMLRRSVPLWRSDAQSPANYDIEMIQLHNMNFSTWLPCTGTNAGRIWDDTYRIRSAYSGAMAAFHFFSARTPLETDPEKIAWLRKYLHEYRKARPYFYADFYPLTDKTRADLAWCASQYNRPESRDGMVQVFKRENSPYIAAAFKLRGLDKDKTYVFTDADDGTTREYTGQEMTECGFVVEICESRVAKLFFYTEKV